MKDDDKSVIAMGSPVADLVEALDIDANHVFKVTINIVVGQPIEVRIEKHPTQGMLKNLIKKVKIYHLTVKEKNNKNK